MKKLKLMADYQCSPLWKACDNEVGNVDPRTLPISEELSHDLEEWALMYDSTLNMDDPSNSGFDSVESENAFKKMGEVLVRRWQKELGDQYTIIYKK